MNGAPLETLRRQRPLVHCISNIVSAGDCANLVLAVGASPVMAQDAAEMADISAASAATVLNTGTPDEGKFSACRAAGIAAAALGRPIVLDPVGVGASPWRRERVAALLWEVHPSILRVNLGEAQALLGTRSDARGVDSAAKGDAQARLSHAKALAKQLETVVLLSGAEDVVTDGTRTLRITGGSEWMGQVTGTGCMLSVLCGAFAAVEPDGLSAAVVAALFWKICSQQAQCRAAGQGLGSFHTALFDVAGAMTAAQFSKCAQGMWTELE